MNQHDEADLAAIRILQQLVEREGIEFVSSRGVSALASAASSFLLRQPARPERGAAFANWLMEQVEVRDLYVDDDELEAILHEVWDARSERASQPTVEARRADFEAMLRREPDNLEHRLVYGDWLQAHRDPLGELITRQVAVALEPDNLALQRAAAIYLSEHAEALFGPLAEYLDAVVRLGWRGGFIESATLGKALDDPEPYEGAILLRWLLDNRTAMLLRELELRPFEHSWGRDQLRALLGVVLEQPRPLLLRLIVGSAEATGELGDLAQLDELLPNLETLELRVRSVGIERLRHPTLRGLVWHGAIGPKQVAALASFELPRLESLGLSLRSTTQTFAPMLEKLELPSLRSLQVPGTADNLDWLVRAPWRERLEHLDLSDGDLQDVEARTLARLRWPRLRRLDVSNNELGAESIALLSALAPEVETEGQRRAELLYDEDEEGDEDEDDEYYESAME